MITLAKMTQAEYDAFYRYSREQHIKELMEEAHMSPEDARAETDADLSEMLPDGLDTEENFLFAVRKADGGETVGFVWTLHEYCGDIKQSFLYDFAVYEEHRRNGYGRRALMLAEEHARQMHCAECVLFVRDDNAPAIALYESCGYIRFRDSEYGFYMKKALAPLSE